MALSCSAIVVKWLLIISNVLVSLFGVALLYIGGSVISGNAIQHLSMYNDTLKSSAGILFLVGSLALIIGILGCISAWSENSFWLAVYATLVGLLILAQFTIAILLISYFRWDFYSVDGYMVKWIEEDYGLDYENDRNFTTETWNKIQIQYHCCGISEGPEDWKHTAWYNVDPDRQNKSVPDSCCVHLFDSENFTNPVAKDPYKCYKAASNSSFPNREQYVHVKGCEQIITRYNIILKSFICSILVLQEIIFCMTCYLRRGVRKASRTHCRNIKHHSKTDTTPSFNI